MSKIPIGCAIAASLGQGVLLVSDGNPAYRHFVQDAHISYGAAPG